MKKIIGNIALTLLSLNLANSWATPAAANAASNNAATTATGPVLLVAHLDTKQVDNALNQPQNANMASLPFYMQACEAAPAPTSYANAKGEAIMIYDPAAKKLDYTIVYSGLSGPAKMAHFHTANPGVAGPIVQSICGMPPPNQANLGSSSAALNGADCPANNYGYISGSYTLQGNPALNLSAAQEEQKLLSGQLYINFHTCLNMAGEIRGQIVTP